MVSGSEQAPDVATRQRRQRAWYFYDWANSAYVTTTATVLFGPYLTSVAKQAACPGQDTDLVCETNLSVLGLPVNPGSLALYTITAATLLSAFVLPVVGALVDRTGRKVALMSGFAWVGALAAACLGFVAGTNWGLGVVLQMIAALCLGSSLVAYDAILIDIATPDERDRVSSRGWALGYAGGGLLLAVNLGVVTAHDALGMSTGTAVRLSLFTAGLWWALFTLVPYLGLRSLPIVAGERSATAAGRGSAGQSLARQSFGQLRETFTHLRGYPQTLLFLLAYLLYNDGIQTVISASSIFGQEQLHLSSDQLIIVILVVQFVAMGGALLFGQLAARFGAWRSILASLGLWCVVVSLGYLVPDRAFVAFLGLGVFIGIVLGGSQALSRSLFSQLIPRGREAEYFSLYQAAERGTSWFGTLLFGLVFQITHSYRYAILALVLFFIVGGVLLSRVDIRRGITDAGNTVPAVV
ncbi:MAG: MFS transporter [Kineosporiaceae bacterium]|nr:MFS transporter [Kineosporiaceae bacterium]MBK7624813.1 MFS transporter [Kineosporiaceae bacterium]MBK8076810.1 MFS transporter [Kineosporiaceae bacterium]